MFGDLFIHLLNSSLKVTTEGFDTDETKNTNKRGEEHVLENGLSLFIF